MLRSPVSLPRFCNDERDDWEVMEGVRSRMYERERLAKRSLDGVSGVTKAMRAKLVNWLIEVCLHFHLTPITLHLTIAYLDGFLEVESVKKQQLQLFGVACLLVAAKLEEIYPPNLRDLATLCDGSCTTHDIAEMELKLLTTLHWSLTPVTPLHWLNCYLALMPTNTTKMLWQALRDECTELLSLALHYTTQFPASLLAAACLAIRLNHLTLVKQVSGYDWEHLIDCMEWLWELPPVNIPYEAVRRGERPQPDFHLILSHILQSTE